MIIKSLLFFSLFFISFVFYSSEFVVQNTAFSRILKTYSESNLSSIRNLHINLNLKEEKDSSFFKLSSSSKEFKYIISFKKKHHLVNKVKNKLIILNIKFYGNKFLKKSIIEQFLNEKNLRKGSTFNKVDILNIENILKEFYYENGFFNIKINTLIFLLPGNKVDISINLYEGNMARIKSIKIFGSNFFPNKILVEQFQLSNKYYNLISNKQFNKKELIKDIENLRHFYYNNGFIEFKVNSIQINLSRNKEEMYIKINITEGMQYKFSDIIINSGLENFYQEVKKLIKISSEEIFNIRKVLLIEEKIKYILNKKGYAYPSISKKIIIDNFKKKIKLIFYIDVGNRFYVRYILFEGNIITKDSVLKREVSQIENTLLDLNKIVQSEENLNNLKYFDSIKTKIKRIDGTNNKVDVIFKVQEREFGESNIGIGFGIDSGASIRIDCQHKNILGTGNFLSFKTVKNDHKIYAEVLANHPYFTGHRTSLENKLFYGSLDETLDFNRHSYGISIKSNVPVNKNGMLSFGLNRIHDDLFNIKLEDSILNYLNSINSQYQCYFSNKTQTNEFSADDSFLFCNYSYNNVNYENFPVSGINTEILGKITLFGSTNKYLYTLLKVQNYLPLSKNKKFILINKINLGYSNKISNKEVPFYENFYSGNPSLIRGFKNNSIGPKPEFQKYYKYLNEKESIFCKKTVGGNRMLIVSTEITFPFLSFLFSKNLDKIRTTFFIDVGNIWNTNIRKLNFNYKNSSIFLQSCISSGLSFQWITPLGVLVASYAYPIKINDKNKIDMFQLNFGKKW